MRTPSFEEGLRYFNAKDYKKSAFIFNEILSNPLVKDEEGFLSLLLGIALLRSDDYELAERHLMEVRFKTKLFEDYVHYFLTEVFLKKGEFEEAMESVDLLLTKFPDSAFLCDALIMKADAGLKLGFLEDVGNVLEKYRASGCSLSADYMLRKAELELRSGNLEGGKEDLIRVWSDYQGNEVTIEGLMDEFFGGVENLITTDIFESKMRKLLNAGDFGSVIRLYEKFNYRSDEVFLRAGEALYYLRRYGGAIRTLRRVEDESKRCEALFFIAKSYSRQGDVKKAIDVYREISEKYSECEYADNALYKMSLLNEVERKELLEKVIERFPDSDLLPLVYWEIGWLEGEGGDYERALSYMERVLSANNATGFEKSRALFWMCEFKRRKGDGDWMKLCEEQVSSSNFNYYTVLSLHTLQRSEYDFHLDARLKEDVRCRNQKIEFLKRTGVFEFVKREVKGLSRRYPELLTDCVLSLITDFPEMRSFVVDKDAIMTFPQGYREIVLKTADAFKVDPYLLFAVIKAESEFDRYAVSSAGAMGAAQIMPGTARFISSALNLKEFDMKMLFDPEISILMGGWYLKRLMEDFGALVPALSAYNGGPVNVRRWCRRWGALPTIDFVEFIPFSETGNYVKKVITYYIAYQLLYRGNFDTRGIFLDRACPELVQNF